MEWVQVRSQGFPKDGWGVLKPLWGSPDELLFGAPNWIFPFKGKDGLWSAAAAKSLQSCPTLCDPIDRSPPGSAIPGILQARTLEWVAISFSNAWKRKVKVKSLSCVRPSVTPWTAAYQVPPSMGFSRQEYWSGLPLSLPLIYAHISTTIPPVSL